jgi:hypothetical protein
VVLPSPIWQQINFLSPKTIAHRHGHQATTLLPSCPNLTINVGTSGVATEIFFGLVSLGGLVRDQFL